jgi:hypothetical protein
VVGLNGLQTDLGGQDISLGTSGGVKLTASYPLSATTAIEGNVFALPYRTTSSSVSSSGRPGSVNLIVPFFNAQTNQQDGTEISYAPVYAGSAQEAYKVGMLGGEVNGAWAMPAAAPWTVDVLGGLRYLRLRETYTLTTSSPYIPPYVPAGVWETTDRFQATNDFYGLQAGLRARYDDGAFFGTGTAKLALGAMNQKVDISGSLMTDEFTNYTTVQSYPGGYFALPSNIGSYSHTAFSVVPELALAVGYRFNPAASIYLGYSLLYATNVVRPGNQIDRTVNTSQSVAHTENAAPVLQGPASPSFTSNASDFWAQGISIGVSYRF